MDIISLHRRIGVPSNFYNAYCDNIIMAHYCSNDAYDSSVILQVSPANGLSPTRSPSARAVVLSQNIMSAGRLVPGVSGR